MNDADRKVVPHPERPYYSDLTAHQVREILSYSRDTGVFCRRDSGKQVGAPDARGYTIIFLRETGRQYKAHRLAWLHVYGEWPAQDVDHINGNHNDNRIENLRTITHGENMQNIRRPNRNNRTGYLGVCPNGSGYRAEIKVNGKKVNLGTYDTPQEAHTAYLHGKARYHAAGVIK